MNRADAISRRERAHPWFPRLRPGFLLGCGGLLLAASCTLAYCMFGLNMSWNFFWFSPKWNLEVVVDLSGILVALTSMWFLAKASRERTSRVAALLFCVLLLAAGSDSCFRSEKTPTAGREQALVSKIGPQATTGQVIGTIVEIQIARAFSHSEPSPIWYRGSHMLIGCLPGAFWAFWTWRHLTHKRSPTHGNQPICSD